MAQYHIWTIGCQMNKAESERLGSYFEQLGYQATTTAEKADVIFYLYEYKNKNHQKKN